MCDREHFDTLRDRVDRLEDAVNVYHARTDERLKTLFRSASTCHKTTLLLVQESHSFWEN